MTRMPGIFGDDPGRSADKSVSDSILAVIVLAMLFEHR